MTKRREIIGAKAIAAELNISIRAFWSQHKVKPLKVWRLRPGGPARIYVSDLDKYKRERRGE